MRSSADAPQRQEVSLLCKRAKVLLLTGELHPVSPAPSALQPGEEDAQLAVTDGTYPYPPRYEDRDRLVLQCSATLEMRG